MSKRLKQVVSELAGLPRGAVMDVPCLFMTGREELVVENHRGVALYSPVRVAVQTSCGLLRVEGSRLQLAVSTQELVIIVGKIEGVSFGEGLGKA